MSTRFLFIHSYINKQVKGYILVGSLTRLKTLVYKINGAEYIKVYIKHNGELNPGVIPVNFSSIHCTDHDRINWVIRNQLPIESLMDM